MIIIIIIIMCDNYIIFNGPIKTLQKTQLRVCSLRSIQFETNIIRENRCSTAQDAKFKTI